MAPATLLKLALLVAWPLVSIGSRVTPGNHRGEVRLIEGQRGVPKLEVLRTSSPEDVASYLEEWSTARRFGLFVQLAPASVGRFQQRVALLGICRGSKVLLFDVRPFLRQQPRPLPSALSDFLSDEKNTFFGMGLLRPVAQLTEEFDIDVRVIDLKVRGWKQVNVEAGFYRVAERYLGFAARRASLRQLQGQAIHTYLQWALADYCISSFGKPQEGWVLTEEELSEARPKKVRTLMAKPGVGSAEGEEEHEMEARAEQLIRRREMMQQRVSRATWGQAKRERLANAREWRGRAQQLGRLTKAASRSGQ